MLQVISWCFDDVNVRISHRIEDCEFDPDSEPDLKDLELYVVQRCDSKWDEIASLLGLDFNTISSIDRDFRMNKGKLRRVLQVWMNQSDEQRKWSDIFNILQKVGEWKLASSLCATCPQET